MTLTPSGRGRPKGSSSLKGSKSKSSKASASLSTNDTAKKSQVFDNQAAVLDAQTNVLHTVDEQVIYQFRIAYTAICITDLISVINIGKRRESSVDMSGLRSC